MDYQEVIENIFSKADIKINGNRPQDIQVKDPRFYKRFLKDGSLGLGEAYMDGWWECEKIDEMFFRLFRSMVYQKTEVKNLNLYLTVIKAKIFPEGGKSRSHFIGKKHYDLGNELFQHMLDKRMAYACGYWKNAKNLEEAQEAKLDLICRKLKLKPGLRVLDVGCGWGSFAKYAAEKYGVKVTGVTVSKEQIALGRKMCGGLPVELRYQDYREVSEKFDRIASIGMFEHVGLRFHKIFMKKMRDCLHDDGLFLLHTIVVNRSKPPDPWLEKYIFPGCRPPSIKEIGKSAEGNFVIEDTHHFGPDYDKTGMVWCDNFKRSWDKIKSQYDDRFYRMWIYYLQSGAAAFRARYSNLYQIVLSKEGIPGGYFYHSTESIR